MVDVLEVSAKISTLSEGLSTEVAGERSLACVLPEMVSQIATLLEGTVAVWVLALKEQLDSLRDGVLDFDGLVPLLWDANESLGLWVGDVVVVVRGVRVFLRVDL